MLEEVALSASTDAGASTSATARVIVPERSSEPHGPAPPLMVGRSLTAVTVTVTVAGFDWEPPSLARYVNRSLPAMFGAGV